MDAQLEINSLFGYILVFTSLILAGGITDLLHSVGSIIRNRRNIESAFEWKNLGNRTWTSLPCTEGQPEVETVFRH